MKLTKLFKLSLAAMAVAFSASTAHAAAFFLGNQGARAMGRANAVVADPKDASTIFYNPAGLAALDGKLNVYVGSIFVNPSFSYKDFAGNNQTNDDIKPLLSGHAYVGGRLNNWLLVGLGFNPNEGATVKWPASSPGRTIVREQSLRSLWFQPTLAVDFSGLGIKGLSFGATADLVYSYAYLTQDIALGSNQNGSAAVSGNAFKVGGHFGLLYKPTFLPGLSIGALYRLPVRNTLKGNADFDAPAPQRGLLPPDGKGSVDGIDYPQYAVFGLGYTFFDRLNIEADGVWTNWRDFTRLQFTFPDGSQQVNQRLYKNTLGVRAGIEYRHQGLFAVRAGYEYDPTPIPKNTLDFTLPDVNRDNISAGFTVFLPANFWVDVGGFYLVGKSRSTEHTPTQVQPVVGIYHVSAYEIGVSVGLALGKEEKPVEEVADVPLKDSDSDGVPDVNDACPMVAGNDGTGCPAAVDADNDGVLDNVDKCPGVTGVAPDGCPPPDADADGISDADDKCPNEKGEAAFGGCPNPDPDGDGIQGTLDVCPNEPETKNGYQDTDGCPDELPPEVQKFNGKLEGVRFANASSRLTRDSYPALDAIAATLEQYPELRLEISGHTDNAGDPAKNQVLSQKRADSVRDYLVKKGVAGDRLNAIGYGDTKPVAPNTDAAGRAQNRRIEFQIQHN